MKGESNWRNNIYKENFKIGKTRSDYIRVQNARGYIFNAAFKRKNKNHIHLAITLSDPRTSSKTYWSIMRTFFRGKKIPIIPPSFINEKLVPEFKAKAKYFNDFFLCKCSAVIKDNVITILRKDFLRLSLTIMMPKIIKSSTYQKSS